MKDFEKYSTKVRDFIEFLSLLNSNENKFHTLKKIEAFFFFK